MNKLATIVPVFGIGALVSGLTLIDDNESNVKSLSTGVVVNPLGVVEKKVDLNQSGYVDFIESKKITPTIFSKYGNKIFGLMILLYILLIFSFNRIKNE